MPPFHTTCRLLSACTAAIRPLYAELITTSPEARYCGGWAPASHHWMLGFSSSSFLNARSWPSLVASTLYTSLTGTPSAIRANSRVYFAPLRRPRLPGNFCTSQKSAQLVGAELSLSALYASTVDQTKKPTPHGWMAPSMKLASSPNCAGSSSSNRPSSQPRASSGDSTSTRSQLTLRVSTMALTLAISPLYSPPITLLPVSFSKGS